MRPQLSVRQGDLVDVSALSPVHLRELGDSALGTALRELFEHGREQEDVYAAFDNSTPPARAEN
ncbi:FxSxx-COOH cyclophane-containing RiPP peptide [Nonomuraea sp. NPDC050202]|jgi:FXSXX-COOH protein|uniref:FxSxx-COOH cyclophane-containing RiPP peptide n=1 Tax=Nonomuraea sp. NPDC050202 TaxID=3155035 RepID=UPI0033C932D1